MVSVGVVDVVGVVVGSGDVSCVVGVYGVVGVVGVVCLHGV